MTYEEAHAPHYIAHRKGWLSLHTGEGVAVLGAPRMKFSVVASHRHPANTGERPGSTLARSEVFILRFHILASAWDQGGAAARTRLSPRALLLVSARAVSRCLSEVR